MHSWLSSECLSFPHGIFWHPLGYAHYITYSPAPRDLGRLVKPPFNHRLLPYALVFIFLASTGKRV